VYPNTNRKGDQYVIYKILVPSKVSSKAKKLLEELKNELE
jgi:molecular chaperone DnaJ/curved DNA-binding protein